MLAAKSTSRRARKLVMEAGSERDLKAGGSFYQVTQRITVSGGIHQS